MAITYLIDLFRPFPEQLAIVEGLFEKQFLYDQLTNYLIKVKMWDEEDRNKVRNLNTRRNGIAHKNAEIIRTYINNGKPFASHELNQVVSNKDVLPDIMMTFSLLFKLMDRFYSKAHDER